MAGGVQHVTSSNRCIEQGSTGAGKKGTEGKSSDYWLMADVIAKLMLILRGCALRLAVLKLEAQVSASVSAARGVAAAGLAAGRLMCVVWVLDFLCGHFVDGIS